jgi:hypothetical protein
MALGHHGIEGVKRSLERMSDLLLRQRGAALAWRPAEAEALSAEIESLQAALQRDLSLADAGERSAVAPLLCAVQALGRANHDIIGQALGLVRQWRRILCGGEAHSYDRSGRPVESRAALAGERVA